MGMKPSVRPCGSGMIQKQLGTAYDVVKEVRDNLDAIRDAAAITNEKLDHAKLENRNLPNQHSINSISGLEAELATKQQTLQSGVNIKTIGGQHLLGAGDVELTPESITGLTDLLETFSVGSILVDEVSDLSDIQVDKLKNGTRVYVKSKAQNYIYFDDGDSSQWVQEPVASATVSTPPSPSGSVDFAITLEQFNESAGSGGDDTAAFEAACALSMATGKGIQLLNKTYLLEPRRQDEGDYQFKGFLRGMGDTLIKAFSSPPKQPEGNYKILLPVNAHRAAIHDFRVDSNISEDPANWSLNFDNFTGSRGLVLTGCVGTIVANVRTNNTLWAGIAHYNCDQSVIMNCQTNRCRGNFGDGFYMWGRNFHYENCRTYDVTRIGYVTESNAGSLVTSRNGAYHTCYAEYGHDASGNYGGVEGNVGFWFENYLYVDCYNCDAKDFQEGGFKSVPSLIESAQDSVSDVRYATTLFQNCNIKDAKYGFIVDNIQQGLQNRTHIIGGSAINIEIGVYLGDRPPTGGSIVGPEFGPSSGYLSENYVYIKGLDVRINRHVVSSMAVMQLAGHVEIDGMEVIFDDGFDQALWDNDTTSAYSTFSTFGLASGIKFSAKNVKCFKEFAGVKTDIGVRTKFQSATTRDRLELSLENCNVSQTGNTTKKTTYTNCKFLQLGDDAAAELLYDKCEFIGRRQAGTQAIAAQSYTKDILFLNCKFNFDTSNDYLYIYNIGKVSPSPLARLHGCTFTRNFETNGIAIRFDADPTLKNAQNGIFNLEVQMCNFINTGGTTSNPILNSGFDPADLASVYGTGNYKSGTLINDTTGSVINNF